MYRVIVCISGFTLSSAPQITCDGDVIRSAASSPAFLFFGTLNRLYTATKLRIHYFVAREEYFKSVIRKRDVTEIEVDVVNCHVYEMYFIVLALYAMSKIWN